MSKVFCTDDLLSELRARAEDYHLTHGVDLVERLETIATSFDHSSARLLNYGRRGLMPVSLSHSASATMQSIATELRNVKKELNGEYNKGATENTTILGGFVSFWSEEQRQKVTVEEKAKTTLKNVPGWMEDLSQKLLAEILPEVVDLTDQTPLTEWAATLKLASRLADFAKTDVDRKTLKAAADNASSWSYTSERQPIAKFQTPSDIKPGHTAYADALRDLYAARHEVISWCGKHLVDSRIEEEKGETE